MPMQPNRNTPQQAVDILRRGTGGDYFERNPIAGPIDDSVLLSNSFGSEMARRRTVQEQDSNVALDALRRQAGVKRDLAIDSAFAEDRYAPYFASRANRQADVDSEAAANRQFMSNASALYNRNRAAAREDANMRYLLPAQIAAQADLDAADIAGQSRVAAAEVRGPSARGVQTPQDLVLKGLIDAAGQGLNTTEFDPADYTRRMDAMRNYFGSLIGGGR